MSKSEVSELSDNHPLSLELKKMSTPTDNGVFIYRNLLRKTNISSNTGLEFRKNIAKTQVSRQKHMATQHKISN